MDNFQDDIEKYRKGLLSEHEMHELEKRALNDPFLADAMEGAESINSENFSGDVSQLQQLLKTKKRKWWPMGIAASLLLFITVSYFIYRPTPNKANENLTLLKTDSVKEKELVKTFSLTDSAKEAKSKEKLLALEKPNKTSSSKKNTKLDSVTEFSVASNASGPAINLTFDEAKVAAAPPVATVQTESKEETSAKESIAAVATDAEEKKEVSTDKNLSRATAINKDQLVFKALNNTRIVAGKVTSSDDGSPVPGVSILIPNTTMGFVTDSEGNYSITIPDSAKQLAFSFIGLQTQQVNLGNESTIDVQMPADVTQLSEVVVVGYGNAKKDDDQEEKPIKLANPFGGRRAYNKYLDKNLKYPEKALENKVEGKVTVQFIVDLTGNLKDFAVIRGIGYGCDEEVIRLVKEGPRWNPTLQADTPIESTVRVRLRFRLPKK